MPDRLKPPFSLVAAILSGVLLALCFEPWNFGWLVWFWQWPLLVALWYGSNRAPSTITTWQRVRRGWWLGYVCGFVFFAISCHWFYHTGKVSAYGRGGFLIALAGCVALLGMTLYLGVYWLVRYICEYCWAFATGYR